MLHIIAVLKLIESASYVARQHVTVDPSVKYESETFGTFRRVVHQERVLFSTASENQTLLHPIVIN